MSIVRPAFRGGIWLGILLFAALASPCVSAPAPAPKAPSPAELLRIGDRHAVMGNYTEALDAWRRGLEGSFPSWRGRRFLKPVKVEYLSRDGLRARLGKIMERDAAEGELAAAQKALAAFGLLKEGTDLRKEILQLHEEQVAGFYDPHTKRLYLIREASEDEPLDPGNEKMVLTHEMAHALMDQHFDLQRLDRAAEDDDDMSLAVTGLIEGEATLAMIVGANPEGAPRLMRLSGSLMNLVFGLMKPLLAFSGGDAFAKAPPILRETMLFPYMKGLPFCLSLTRPTGTWAPVDAAFGRPPLSTEQLLHPERYPKDVPLALSLPDVAPALGPGWKPVYANVMGELQTRVLFASALPPLEGVLAAEGWGGDFYRVYERKSPEGPRTCYVWASMWDGSGEALGFREACTHLLAIQLGAEPAESAPGVALPPAMWARVWAAGDAVSLVLGRERSVWVLRGIPRPALPGVLARVLTVRSAPKRFVLKPAGKQR